MKRETAWAIKHWRCGFYPDTVHLRRRDTVRTFKKMYGISKKEWRDDVRYGVHRAVKVTISAVRPQGPMKP